MSLFDGHSIYAECRGKGQRSLIHVFYTRSALFVVLSLQSKFNNWPSIHISYTQKRNIKVTKNLDLVDLSDIAVISAISSEVMVTGTVSNEKLHSSSQSFSYDISAL